MAGIAQAAEYTDTAIPTDNLKVTETTTFKVSEGTTVTRTGNITGNGDIIKDGTGKLSTRINDQAGIDGSSGNEYFGNITVNAGELNIYASTGNPCIGAAQGDKEATITVAKDAKLTLSKGAGISIPGGNTNPGEGKPSITIRNDKNDTPAYGISTLSNVVVQGDSIKAADSTARGVVVATEVAPTDLTAATPAHIQNTDVYADHLSVTGHSVVDNATVHVSRFLYQLNTSGENNCSLQVTNGSKLILDNVTGGPASWGVLKNTTVDKTSAINSGDENGKLMTTEPMRYLTLQAGNKLEIASTENGGVATRYNTETPATGDATLPSLEVVYVTEQLSGCKIDAASALKVTLEDAVMAAGQKPENYDSFTFTVVLKGLDSHDVLSAAAKGKEIVSGQFYTMGANSPVWLELPDNYDTTKFEYNSAVTIASFTSYEQDGVDQGPATVFRFLANRTPEPATATLSLLALAGLAARRRRH